MLRSGGQGNGIPFRTGLRSADRHPVLAGPTATGAAPDSRGLLTLT